MTRISASRSWGAKLFTSQIQGLSILLIQLVLKLLSPTLSWSRSCEEIFEQHSINFVATRYLQSTGIHAAMKWFRTWFILPCIRLSMVSYSKKAKYILLLIHI
jgi:hypothetical protein